MNTAEVLQTKHIETLTRQRKNRIHQSNIITSAKQGMNRIHHSSIKGCTIRNRLVKSIAKV